MDFANITEFFLSIQESVTYLKIGGPKENKGICDEIIEAIRPLKDLIPSEEKAIEQILALFQGVKDSDELPDDISERFWSLSGTLMASAVAVSLSAPLIAQPRLDADFSQLLDDISLKSAEQLLKQLVESAIELKRSNKSYYDAMEKWYRSWYGIKSFQTDDPGFVRHFGFICQYIKKNQKRLQALYDQLGDNRSRYSLLCMIQNWLTFSPDLRYHGIEHTFHHYWDLDLIACDEEEVYVDCGAYNGDSIESFVQTYGSSYKRIYAYELTPRTFLEMRDNLKDYKNVVFRNVGVADKNTTMSILAMDGHETANRLREGNSGVQMPVVALDNDITEKITLIKMDIESAEPAALIGAQKHIRRSHPKLAISLYHLVNHLLDIPELIHQIDPTYRFFLRHTGAPFEGGVPFPTEYILIAL